MSKSTAELDAQILQAMRYLAELLEERASKGGRPASGSPKIPSTPQLISLNDVCRVTSLSRTAINRWRDMGKFPKAVMLGDKRVAFVRSEVEEWVRDRIATGKDKP